MPDELDPSESERGRPSPPFSERHMELGLKLLTNQERQLALEERRLEFEASLAGRNMDISRDVIAAEAQDRRDARRSHLVLVLGLALLGLVMILTLAILGKEALLIDLVKIGAGVALGWGAKAATTGRREDAPSVEQH